MSPLIIPPDCCGAAAGAGLAGVGVGLGAGLGAAAADLDGELLPNIPPPPLDPLELDLPPPINKRCLRY